MDHKFIQRTSNQAPSAALMLDPIMGANFHWEEVWRHAPCSRGRNVTYTSIAGEALCQCHAVFGPVALHYGSRVARPGSQCSENVVPLSVRYIKIIKIICKNRCWAFRPGAENVLF